MVGIAVNTGHHERTFNGLLMRIPMTKTTTSSPSVSTSAVKRPCWTRAIPPVSASAGRAGTPFSHASGSDLAAVALGPADVAVRADGAAGVRAPTRRLLQAVDVLGGLGLGEVGRKGLAGLAGEGLEVAALCPGHR